MKSGQEAPSSESPQEQVDPALEENVEAAEAVPEMEIPDTELGFMVTYAGKYAGQEKLFEQEALAARLKNLERFNYEAMLQR